MPVSVRDIVDRLAKTRVDTSTLSERIRHWTREKLLDLEGDDNPGTGRKRLYGAGAVREAALLNRLAEMGVGVKWMHLAMSTYRDRRPKIDAALSGNDTVLLWLNVDRRAASAGFVVVDTADRPAAVSEMDSLLAGTDSTLIVNLSRTFAGL